MATTTLVSTIHRIYRHSGVLNTFEFSVIGISHHFILWVWRLGEKLALSWSWSLFGGSVGPHVVVDAHMLRF